MTSARDGYEQAIATLRDVADRTGNPAAAWAADYLTEDPDRLAPAPGTLHSRRRTPMATELREPLPDFDHPHGWTWRDNCRVRSSIHVEPAFKSELGAVFIRIDQEGKQEQGIWLPRDVMEEFIAAMRVAADVPNEER